MATAMNCHQVLHGAANDGDHCFAVGCFNGQHYTVYAVGSQLIILNGEFKAVQKVSCVDVEGDVVCLSCSSLTAKIAVSFGTKVCIFEPQEGISQFSATWQHSTTIDASFNVAALSFNSEGDRVLLAGSAIELWSCYTGIGTCSPAGNFSSSASASVGAGAGVLFTVGGNDDDVIASKWSCVWRGRPTSSVAYISFTTDGLMFANVGHNDRCVQIWREKEADMDLRFNGFSSRSSCQLSFQDIIVAHPRPVTWFSWRKTSKHMERRCVSNVLLTLCLDNVCRIWCEAITFEDEPSPSAPLPAETVEPSGSAEVPDSIPAKEKKKRLSGKFHRLRPLFSRKRLSRTLSADAAEPDEHHSHSCCRLKMFSRLSSVVFHFHLVASIDPDVDIPGAESWHELNKSMFIVHWLNNKQLRYSAEMENLLQEFDRISHENQETQGSSSMPKSPAVSGVNGINGTANQNGSELLKPLSRPTSVSSTKKQKVGSGLWRVVSVDSNKAVAMDTNGASSPVINTNFSAANDLASPTASASGMFVDDLEPRILKFLDNWCLAGDVLFALHPLDGSLLVWVVKWLDPLEKESVRQVDVVFAGKVHSAMSVADAAGLSRRLFIFPNISTLQSAPIVVESQEPPDGETYHDIRLVAKHSTGAICQWRIMFDRDSVVDVPVGLEQLSRTAGHKFRTTASVSHPVLPLMITTAHRSDAALENHSTTVDICSELIVWRISPIGPVGKTGGMSELARMQSSDPQAFTAVCWLPALWPSSVNMKSPSSVFIAFDGSCLRVYQVVIDARFLLTHQRFKRYKLQSIRESETNLESEFDSDPNGSLDIVSQHSTLRPGCIIRLDTISDSLQDWHNIQLMHAIDKCVICGNCKVATRASSSDDNETFALIICEKLVDTGQSQLHMWKVVLSHSLQEELNSSPTTTHHNKQRHSHSLQVHSTKVCAQKLPLPVGVEVVSMCIAAGHPSSASVYPICKAPYLLVTGCSDQTVRCWSCELIGDEVEALYVWTDWVEISGIEHIKVPGRILSVSSAYNGRLAVAQSTLNKSADPISVAIYEYESSGGCQWKLEECIHLKQHSTLNSTTHVGLREKAKHLFTPKSNRAKRHSLTWQDEPVDSLHLTWLSTEDGGHVLTASVGSRLLLYAATVSDADSAKNRTVGWRLLRDTRLSSSATSFITWVRNGLLCVGLANEIHVYSQWKSPAGRGVPKKVGLVSSKSAPRLQNISSSQNLILPGCYSAAVVPNASISNLLWLAEKSRSRELAASSVKLHDADGSGDSEMDVGLFEEVHQHCPTLPQYHPTVLLELLNYGKVLRVKAILLHLVRCIAADCDNDRVPLHRRMSVIASPTQRGSIPTETPLAYIDIKAIPLLPMYALLAADKNISETQLSSAKPAQPESDYNALFEGPKFGEKEPQLDLDMSGNDGSLESIESELKGIGLDFGPKQSQLLSRFLMHAQLPGLSRLDQMYLAALAETVATENFETAILSNTENDEKVGKTSTVDECGMKFLLSARHHTYLLKTLPLNQRSQLQKDGLSAVHYVWAFHSECQEDLLESLKQMSGELTWSILRQFGGGWWLRKLTTLRTCVEQIARIEFKLSGNPLDGALFFFALKRKNVVWGLYRSLNDTKMAEFFHNNFTEDRWRRAALKNAFSLLGKQRYLHAAAFFLLAGALSDAVDVCLNNLNDIQLAIVITRLHDCTSDDSVPPILRQLIEQHCLDITADNSTSESTPSLHTNPFIRSIGHWILKDYISAKNTLLQNVSTSASCEEVAVSSLYSYLRSHRLVTRHLAQLNTGSLQDNEILLERKLYFATAYAHLRHGCPSLALEALQRLPPNCVVQCTARTTGNSVVGNSTCNEQPMEPKETAKSDMFDWSTPLAHFESEELKLDIDDKDDDEASESESDAAVISEDGRVNGATPLAGGKDAEAIGKALETAGKPVEMCADVVADQLKYIACLKIMMEELSTQATGFQVDRGLLRLQLYSWLEKEIEVLRLLCNYSSSDVNEMGSLTRTDDTSPHTEDREMIALRRISSVGVESLLGADVRKLSTSSGVPPSAEVVSERKRWIRSHNHLLRCLLSYSVLHGSAGGGLASVRIELALLLQESRLIQRQRHDVSVMSMPPLLMSCLSGVKTVFADPVYYLQSLASDLVSAIVDEFKLPPNLSSPLNCTVIIRELGAALSACVYQCLSDWDPADMNTSTEAGGGGGGPHGDNSLRASTSIVYRNSFLTVGAEERRRRMSSAGSTVIPSSHPADWPGVLSLCYLLAEADDDDVCRLNYLLCASLLAVYTSLLVHALAVYDANILYRLVAQHLSLSMWRAVFGGGSGQQSQPSSPASSDIVNNNQLKNFKTVANEHFVAPETSLFNYIMMRPLDKTGVVYESTKSLSAIDEGQELLSEDADSPINSHSVEHLDPNSFSWRLMRYAIVRHCLCNINTFLHLVGIELKEVATGASLIRSIVSLLQLWQSQLKSDVENFPGGKPENFLPDDTIPDNTPIYTQYSILANPQNTPFQTEHYSALPAKRLWNFLVSQESLRDIFLQYALNSSSQTPNGTMRSDSMRMMSVDGELDVTAERMKAVYTSHDAFVSFCINQLDASCVAIATSKSILELDAAAFGQTASGEQTEQTVDAENKPQRPSSLKLRRSVGLKATLSAFASQPFNKTRRHSNKLKHQQYQQFSVVKTNRGAGVRKLASHPQLPCYLSASHDGIVRLWSWGGETEAVCIAKESNCKITQIVFSSQGNKFAVSTDCGFVNIWVSCLDFASSSKCLSVKCHSKSANDVTFLGSSASLFATAGHSDDSSNVCLWDSLLAQPLVHSFECHADGATSLVYLSRQQVLVSAGSSGDVCMWDIRQRRLRHRVPAAHESMIKCLTFGPDEDYFVTGSLDGDIKVWDVSTCGQLCSYSAVHSRSSSVRHNIVSGVSCLRATSEGRVWSSGLDGSLHIHRLPWQLVADNNRRISSYHGASSGATFDPDMNYRNSISSYVVVNRSPDISVE